MGRKWIPGLALVFTAALLFSGYQLSLGKFAEKEKALRSRLRKELVTRFAEDAADAASRFGLQAYRPAGLPPVRGVRKKRAVILVHGLDDPGKVWMNLAPALATQGHQVFQLFYPNDQPIHDSARFFAATLEALPPRKIRQVIIVAHSMGGLVSRDMLTHPRIDYLARVAAGRVPRVEGLIMVGTPNQGAEIARLRVLAEFREQISRALLGQGHWLDWLVDGAGEAKIDLLPESRFLTDLNSRPHPPGTALLTIAGIAAGNLLPPSPQAPPEILPDTLSDTLPDTLPETLKVPSLPDTDTAGDAQLPTQSQWAEVVANLAQRVGDGLVPVDAVRLPGVEQLTVSGTHLSMIRNILVESSRSPPAVPIILDRVLQWENRPQKK